jgi:hypothetical protein
MNFTLIRYDILATGSFGVLLAKGFHCETLEHSYVIPLENTIQIKIPEGIYTCKRGVHRLESMTSGFETFEIENVPGHTNILFHVGNQNKDSAGCVLLGFNRSNNALLFSKSAFDNFMEFLKDVNEFTLEVKNAY